MVVPKFRAWVEAEETMHPVLSLDWSGIDDNLTVFVPMGHTSSRAVSIDNAVLMQSTGLFSTFSEDELFEDDVIFWTYFDEFEDTGKARIVYRDGCWKLLDIKTGKETWDSLFDCLENCTVFLSGNIYENPELEEATND
ncbi:YopX family protein [Streptococcus suis]|uniref:YopX family protein n=1 Tax=Streptococcus suis TaxID=1307 RepID=UPI00041848FA|nr:YopX family protein [Streptococcus suis]HEM3230588.1 hypothetical protein [Streptococcus suis 2726]HEM4074224.1 hypothetical protein [Streptococcus suis]